MNTPNDYVRLNIAKSYIADRLQYEETRRKIKQTRIKKPSRFYCGVCRTLVYFGHVLVAFGRRLDRYDLVLRDSQT